MKGKTADSIVIFLFCFVVILLCGLGAMLIYFFGSLNMSCNIDECSRKCNDFHEIQAIQVGIDCGATTTTSFAIRLVGSCDTNIVGKPINTIYTGDQKVKMEWISSDTLEIITKNDRNDGKNKRSYVLPNSRERIWITYK